MRVSIDWESYFGGYRGHPLAQRPHVLGLRGCLKYQGVGTPGPHFGGTLDVEDYRRDRDPIVLPRQGEATQTNRDY